MKQPCQGYCGGYVKLENICHVGFGGERFCPECYGKKLRKLYRQPMTMKQDVEQNKEMYQALADK